MTNKQTILVAGATGNIGGGAAVALAKRGARVVLLGHRHETLEARADSIRVALSEARIEHQDTDIATLVVDFTDMEAVRGAAAEAISRFATDRWAGTFCSRLSAIWSEHPAQRS